MSLINTSGTLNVWLSKPDERGKAFHAFIKPDKHLLPFELDPSLGIDGIVYVQSPEENRPSWATLLDALTGTEMTELSSKTSSAVLFMRTKSNLFALTFGYGRFLIEPAYFIQDFGLKTALNTLNPQALKSVNLHTLDDQPIQKQTRAARNAQQNIFGIDVFKDILRSVTGSPKPGLNIKSIRGSGPVLSFSTRTELKKLPETLDAVTKQYHNNDYKQAFAWVDNIRKVTDSSVKDSLDQQLLEALNNNDASLLLTITEDINWDTLIGFSFTRSKRTLHPELHISNYYHTLKAEFTPHYINKKRPHLRLRRERQRIQLFRLQLYLF